MLGTALKKTNTKLNMKSTVEKYLLRAQIKIFNGKINSMENPKNFFKQNTVSKCDVLYSTL
jgi:hypothetical protein